MRPGHVSLGIFAVPWQIYDGNQLLDHVLLLAATMTRSFKVFLWLLCCCAFAPAPDQAATLSDPAVDAFDTRVGTQTFSGLYQFTTNNLLIETAQAILGMGSENIKMFMGANYPGKYNTNLPPSVTSLMTLAKYEPNCHAVLDMPFKRIIAWAYPLSNSDAPFQDGNYTSTEAANDYREMYDLAHYLLTNYNNSGKTFYLGHWEGDGYLSVNDWSTNPPPAEIPAMIAWLNNRQKAIDDARAATTFSNVNVFGYSEVNRVRDAMVNGATNNQRSINYVIPYVTNLDYVSYSSYDAMNLSTANLYSTLDYIEAHMPTNKAGVIPGERLWIGEYGWGGNSSDSQEPLNRAYIQRLLNYGRQALPFILFWEIYNNEAGRNFWLIDTNNVKVASYYLHQRFINNARLFTARFKESNGRLPTDSEFVAMVSPPLDNPLPAPVNLLVSNLSASLVNTNAVSLSGSLVQGVYGDDRATVRVFWGRQDGGSVRVAWEHSQTIGTNTNFNSTVFTALVTNLSLQTNYYFRFYATNASGESWAPTSAQFSTASLAPSDYGSRLKISFTGYNRGEPLPDFKVLVNLSTNLPGFSYRRFASPIGADLRFTDSGGVALLSHEIDEWNTNGASSVWVKLSALSGANDFVWAYWGNPLAATLPAYATNGSVWSGDHFLVWHLKETGFPFNDSAQQFPALSGAAPSSTTGVIGHGVFFNGTSQYLNAGAINLGNAFTLSAWVKIDATATNIQTIWANKTGGFNTDGFSFFVNDYQTANQKLLLETGNGTTGLTAASAAGAVSFNQWHRLTATVDRAAGVARLYVDGSDVTQASAIRADLANQSVVNLARFTKSGFYFKGALDEARIESGLRSSNWVWANWMNVASNSAFLSYSTVTQQTPGLSLSAPGSGMILSWPASGVGFSLYSASNLAPPVLWNPLTNQPAFVNSQWQILLTPNASSNLFYRLQSP
jgi:hypothetical protein